MADVDSGSLSVTFAAKLRALSEEKKISRAQLAEKLQVSRQMIDKYFNREVKSIPAEKVVALAEILGVSTDYLLTDTQYRTPDCSIRGACAATGLSEEAMAMLLKPEVNEAAEFLLRDEGNLELFKDLRAYIEAARSPEEAFRFEGGAEPDLCEDAKEIVIQMLLNRLRKGLEKACSNQ